MALYELRSEFIEEFNKQLDDGELTQLLFSPLGGVHGNLKHLAHAVEGGDHDEIYAAKNYLGSAIRNNLLAQGNDVPESLVNNFASMSSNNILGIMKNMNRSGEVLTTIEIPTVELSL